jgi:hypothetical protein
MSGTRGTTTGRDLAVGDRVRVYLEDNRTLSAEVGTVTQIEAPRAWEPGDAGCVYVTFDAGHSAPGYHPSVVVRA